MMPDEQPQNSEQNEDRFSAFDEPVRPDETKKKKSKINPRLRTLLIAVGLAALLAVILLLVLILPQGNADFSSGGSAVEEVQYYPVLKKDDSVIAQAVSIQNKTGSYTLRYDEKQKVYQLVGYEDLSLGANVDTVAETLKGLNATGRVEQATALADYGLETPTATVKADYSDGSACALLIGNETPSKEGYYVKLADDSTVYICSTSTMDYFLDADASFVSTTLITPPTVKEDDANGKAALKSVTLTGTAHPQKLSLRRMSTDDQQEYTYFSYLITDPYLRGTTDAVADALTGFTSLIADHAVVLHPTASDKKQYGFDSPYTVADMEFAVETTSTKDDDTVVISYYNSSTARLTVGSKNSNGDYYVMMDGINAIFLVSSGSLSEVVERQYDNTVSSLLFIKDITTVSRVDMTVDGKTHCFMLKHSPDEEDSDKTLTVTKDGKTYSTPDFRTLYQLMMSISRYGKQDASPSGQPNLDITLYQSDGTVFLTAHIYPATGSVCTVRTSEGEQFAAKASAVTNFIKQLENYLDGKTVLQS